jgi:hypothetical protein
MPERKRMPKSKPLRRDPDASALVATLSKVDIERMYEKGRLAVAHLFGGDLELARSPKARRAALSRITHHPRADSAAEIWFAIDLFDLLESDPRVREAPSTYLLAAMRAPRRQRGAILRRAVTEGWSLPHLERAIDELPRRAGGRKPLPPQLRWVLGCMRALPQADDTNLGGLTRDQRRQLRMEVAALLQALDKISTAIGGHMGEHSTEA